MKFFLAAILLTCYTVSDAIAQTVSPGNYYVTTEKLNVRLSPEKNGKLTNVLRKNQKVEVFEVKNGWARISHFYDGRAEGSLGKESRWVFAKYLSTKKIPEKSAPNDNSPITNAIKHSDDFSKYKDNFVTASDTLIKSGKCSLEDLKEMGGWMRSGNHKPKPVYFTYCNGNDRFYLNATTGEISK